MLMSNGPEGAAGLRTGYEHCAPVATQLSNDITYERAGISDADRSMPERTIGVEVDGGHRQGRACQTSRAGDRDEKFLHVRCVQIQSGYESEVVWQVSGSSAGTTV